MKKILAAIIFLILIFGARGARADGPQILITWSSDSYVPAGYSGKALPINGGHIKARVAALLGNNFLDLSKEDIAWNINGTPLLEGIGAQTAEFDVSTITQSSLEMEVQILSLQGGPFSKTIQIPIAQPQAVIKYTSPGGSITGNGIFLTALPFFFRVHSISELSFSWQINGVLPASPNDPQHLNIKSSSGFSSGSQVQVLININKGASSASENRTFTAR